MKHLIFLTIISLFTFSSCKKDRTCSCTYPDGSKYAEFTITRATKKDAKLLCTTKVQTVNCVIK